ncbi:MAG TPA: LysM domain-containing protein, partial [Polyangium sp.]|nr:LysM domain-containing protein [Polyangium sp.]
MRATTLSYMGPNFEADTGDFLGTLAGLLGGGANASNPAGGGGPGKTLGSLGGASIAAALGMPQFAPMAASAGSMLGGLAQQGIEGLTKPKPPKPRQLTRNERRIIEQGRQKAKQTGNEAFAQEALLRVHRPAEYKRLKGLGKLPSQSPAPSKPAPAPAPVKPLPPPVATQPQPAPGPTAPPVPTRPALNLAPLFEGLNDIERAQLELAVQEGRGAEMWNRIRAERTEQETRTPTRTFNVSDNGAQLVNDESPPFEAEMDGYSETSGPPNERPQPKKHVAIVPIQQGQLEGLLRAVPALQKLDKRLLKLLAGLGSKARDVSGVDPKRGVYHAEPGETPTGIAKRLTGRAERVNELFAANPGNPGPIWHIPPGWLAYESDTGAIMAMRRYTVVQNDTPYKIAQKHGAFSTRAKWWTELKQANPDKPTKDGGANWTSLYAGEEIGLPDVWFALGDAPPPRPPSPVPVPQLP